VDFLLANAIVFYMHWVIKKNLAEFNLADFRNLPNYQNKFYAKFLSYTVSQKNLHIRKKLYSSYIYGLYHPTPVPQSVALPAGLPKPFWNHKAFNNYLKPLVTCNLHNASMHDGFSWHTCFSGILVKEQ